MPRLRTLLALAIGLALAALAALVIGPHDGNPRGTNAQRTSPARRNPAVRPVTLELRAGRPRPSRVVTRVGKHTLVTVEVPAPGEVDLAGVGLTDSATPEAPAAFDLLPDRPGRFEAVFRPAEGPPQPAGLLVVTPR
jgi:hypothetical protein